MKILVLGGTGFIGKQMCREALRRGYQVQSLTRQGSAGIDITKHPWAKEVDWRTGSALDPDTIKSSVHGCHSIIHSIGILIEKPSWNFSSTSSQLAQFPTYEKINRDTALIAAREALSLNTLRSFIFVSAAGAPPLLSRYLQTKRQVEKEILSYPQDKLRSVVLRPGIVYHKSKASSIPLSGIMKAVHELSTSLGKITGRPMEGFDEPTSLDILAKAAIEATQNENIQGILDNKEMEHIADKVSEEDRDAF